MPLSIVSLFLFKHTLWPGRLRQVIASTTNSKHPSAGGQLLKSIQALNWPLRGARWGPLAGGQGQPPYPWLPTQSRVLRNKNNHVVIFSDGIFAPNSHRSLESTCAHLSPRPAFVLVLSRPRGGVPGQASHAMLCHAMPREHGHPHSSLLGCTWAPHTDPQLHSFCHWEANRFDLPLGRSGG